MLIVNSYISYITFKGSITSTIFEKFLEYYILPYCIPYLGLRLVIIIDNTSIYWLARIQELCKRAGVIIEFLLLYLLDLNLIKATFKDLKT